MKKLLPDPELESLIRTLNSAAWETEKDEAVEPSTAGEVEQANRRPAGTRPLWSLVEQTDEAEEWLSSLLSRSRKAHASDLLLVVGAPPVVRINGRLQSLGRNQLSGAATDMLCAALVPATHRGRAESHVVVDFSFRLESTGRFRCNVHRQRGHWSAAVRLLAHTPPDLRELNLPDLLSRFAELEHGLVLVTGPTGCGKSTTLAALIRRILERRRVHLVTIEDPVEYEHPHTESVVEHVELGRDVVSFAAALRSALRQDPDVLLIGEMRDPESMSIAITAAETGHLVLSTLHTGDSSQTIHRILDSYPANQMDVVRAQLSASLAGIISQQLLPRRDGKGRVPAVEILVATPGVRNLVRLGKIEQLRSQITLERQSGMLDLDRSLARLVQQGLVDGDEARCRARQPGEFDALV
jgi:twitching motility protein PilT